MPASMRQTIARYMTLSKQSIPHYYLTRRADVSAALHLREVWNTGRGKEDQITVNDLMLRAVALALGEHPQFNGFYREDGFQPEPTINLGVAIALPEGLIAPAILDCASLPIEEIARCSRDLSKRARLGKLKAAEYTGATFTVSNLGMYQVDSFTAIIVPPQVGILAVGAIIDVIVPRNGQPVFTREITLTLSADHRATDGTEGAHFLGAIVGYLQDPQTLFKGSGTNLWPRDAGAEWSV